ncbi:MAG: hypothetical protein GY926_12070 [bacterium]|nr:hypothetical protein [bacterium]
MLRLCLATEADYKEWLVTFGRKKRILFWAAVILTAIAGLIEVSWSVGAHWHVWIPPDGAAALSQLLKWLLGAVGVGGIAFYREYRSI